MGSVHEVIEAFRAAPSNSERGTKFEQLMVRYFELDPMLSQQYDQVWRWIDWPDRKGKPDTGIDLVARERDTGEYTAIQCKFYEPTPHPRQGGHRLVLHRLGQEAVHQPDHHLHHRQVGQATPRTRWTTRRSRCSGSGWPRSRSPRSTGTSPGPRASCRSTSPQATRHEPRPHQQEAIDAVFDGFAVGNDRGKLIMACGTGKTFTALKIAERIAAENGGARPRAVPGAVDLAAVPDPAGMDRPDRGWICGRSRSARTPRCPGSAEDIQRRTTSPIPATTDPARLVAAR